MRSVYGKFVRLIQFYMPNVVRYLPTYLPVHNNEYRLRTLGSLEDEYGKNIWNLF